MRHWNKLKKQDHGTRIFRSVAKVKIGFIGLGRMGQPMAHNILRAGHELFIHDIREEACAPLIDEGGEKRKDPQEVAGVADVIVTSLPGPKEVEVVMMGNHGVIEGARKNSIVIDTSTVGPGLSKKLAQQFHSYGVAYLDAPVTGGRERAVSGTLAIMIGGPEDAFERARPVLSCIGRDLFHLGPSGSGNIVKLIVQMIYLPYVAAFCEGLALGENMGIAFDQLFSVLIKSSAGQPGFEKRYNHLKAGDLTPRFEVDMAVKDLTLACELFAEIKQPGHIVAAAREAYEEASSQGWGRKDLTALRAMCGLLRENDKQ
jgi:3-hydroxyisobutyrate dehydrogenase-like beta-hydroxyacid dehydrogenase